MQKISAMQQQDETRNKMNKRDNFILIFPTYPLSLLAFITPHIILFIRKWAISQHKKV